MSKYIVYIMESWRERIEVEADSVEEAHEKALRQSNFIDPDVSDLEEL